MTVDIPPHPAADVLEGRELNEWQYWIANQERTAARLLDLADFLDEFGIGMGDHSDRPLLVAAASILDVRANEMSAIFATLKAMTKSIEAALSGEAVFNDSLLSDAKTLIAKVEGRS